MQTPPNINNFQLPSVAPAAVTTTSDQPTLVAHGRRDNRIQPLSQAGFIASSSDNLFHPVPARPPSHAYTLPNVPLHPRFSTYNPPDTFQRPFNYRSPFSSYNNPTFAISNRASPSSNTNAALGQSPPVPHRIHPRPLSPPSQPPLDHTHQAYIQPPFVYHHSQHQAAPRGPC